jgi:hypothetical protein
MIQRKHLPKVIATILNKPLIKILTDIRCSRKSTLVFLLKK